MELLHNFLLNALQAVNSDMLVGTRQQSVRATRELVQMCGVSWTKTTPRSSVMTEHVAVVQVRWLNLVTGRKAPFYGVCETTRPSHFSVFPTTAAHQSQQERRVFICIDLKSKRVSCNTSELFSEKETVT